MPEKVRITKSRSTNSKQCSLCSHCRIFFKISGNILKTSLSSTGVDFLRIRCVKGLWVRVNGTERIYKSYLGFLGSTTLPRGCEFFGGSG